MRKIEIGLAGLLLVSGALPAQSIPPLMNYQGNLSSATGQPLANGQYTLTFNVYNVPTGGSPVWGPQAIVADVIDGYFNVVLSTDSAGGDSITTAFIAQPRYVSIRVDAAAEILPRQQVLSAPYAIQANRAAAADVVAPTSGPGNIFPSTGFVGIGTTTPDRELSVTGASLFTGNVDVTGTTTLSGPLTAGVLTVSTIQFTAQKYCRIGTSGQWRDMITVPHLWTIANCSSLRTTLGDGNNYAVGCIFGDGGVSEGPINTGNPPARNCGW